MMGTINCIYETPCGWCSKWDKKCDRKSKLTPEENVLKAQEEAIVAWECDHNWIYAGMSTAGMLYKCSKCGTHKSFNSTTEPIITTT